MASFADGVPSAAARDVSLALVAGEASGDMLAARLLAGLRPHLPDARFHGIGGPRMIEQGMVSDVPMDLLTVRGLFEVIPRYRELKGIQIGGKGTWRVEDTQLQDYIDRMYARTQERLRAGDGPD